MNLVPVIELALRFDHFTDPARSRIYNRVILNLCYIMLL